ncbi:hypothetical protein I316_06833 [Kwoniella heveanensis BCC8398]|uniref:Fumarylacetoacetase-like C-terminal domain-containing protein n=1 Tax=Kwoniella heveanensis BCC8398 TaxID=1296120 RepID=A0A1B9GKA1_9TREE|nr:hypothetical protein I316_06833 [Kwoniella heveanensis BCC8398]
MVCEDFPHKPTKVIGVGKAYTWNYPGEKVPETLPEPLTFLRPTTSLLPKGSPLEQPEGTSIAYETEIAVVIGKEAKNVKVADAMSYIEGYALAMDMCAREVQTHARKEGLPWAVCKGADTLNPIGRFIKLDEIPDPHNVNLKLVIDGKVAQDGNSQDLIYTIAQEIAYISSYMTLLPGDIILTGAPKGVSTVVAGAKMVATLSLPDGKVLDEMEIDVVTKKEGYRFGKHWLEWLK